MVYFQGIACRVVKFDASIGLYDLENVATGARYSAFEDEIVGL